ncbi:MAG: Gfo/Idh/MocA family oxidoreductase [Bacteroidetes bacterium]|nr:Gfo/Idh/MocA family oxidoreductase [Bacteroidota bacterium]
MQTVQWGIIGCGDVTEVKSGPALNKVPNSTLVAVMRRDGAKAADYAQRHHVPKWYSDANALINDPEVNAIYVATPPDTHELYALQAIQSGKPVYLEKPMALSFAAAQRIAAAVKERNSKLVVAHYRREQPLFKKIQQLMEEGAVGTIRLARMELYKAPLSAAELQQPQQAWRVNPAIAGGGLFHDLAPHQLDLMYHYFGNVKTVKGIAINQGGLYAADDLVTGSILFDNGIAFSGSWCFNAAATTDHCEIVGSSGSIHFSIFGGNTVTVIAKGITSSYSFEMLQHVQQPMIEKVVQYFRGETHNPCAASEGAEVMRLMEAFTS